MTTGANFITVLQERLGKRTDLTSAIILIEAEIVRETILEAADFYPWFLQSEDATLVTVASQEFLSKPTNFLGIDQENDWCSLAYNDTTDTTADPWIPIEVYDWNLVKAKYKDAVIGPPEFAAYVNDLIYVRPIPDAVYTLRQRYYASDPTIFPSDGTTNLWLTHATDWVIGEVGYVLASQYIRDAEVIKTFDALRASGKARVYKKHIALQEAAKSRSMGDS